MIGIRAAVVPLMMPVMVCAVGAEVRAGAAAKRDSREKMLAFAGPALRI